MITSGRGKYKVWIERHNIGDDIVFFLGGGQHSHIGSVIVAEPGKKVKSIRLLGHYDDLVLRPLAKIACKKYQTKVVLIGGVHVDNATENEIDLLVKNCKRMGKKI